MISECGSPDPEPRAKRERGAMEWMGNEYRLIAKSRCVSLCDLIAAACEAGIKVGVPLSLAEATHALGNVYHGEEMLFDGAYQGLAQAYCVDRPWDEDKLREHMGDVPIHLYNDQWWNDRSIDGIPEVLYVANKSLVVHPGKNATNIYSPLKP